MLKHVWWPVSDGVGTGSFWNEYRGENLQDRAGQGSGAEQVYGHMAVIFLARLCQKCHGIRLVSRRSYLSSTASPARLAKALNYLQGNSLFSLRENTNIAMPTISPMDLVHIPAFPKVS